MITIREATNYDLNFLVNFQSKLAFETENIILNNEILEKGILMALNDSNKGTYYIAEYQKKVCGCFLITYEWSDWKCKTYLWLQSVYIFKEFRKLGIFNAMFSFLKKMVLNNVDNFAGIKLYVDKNNINAQSVYNKIGMNNEHYILYEWIR